MDEFGWRNVHDLRFQLSAKPSKKVDLEFHYHAFWLADTSGLLVPEQWDLHFADKDANRSGRSRYWSK